VQRVDAAEIDSDGGRRIHDKFTGRRPDDGVNRAALEGETLAAGAFVTRRRRDPASTSTLPVSSSVMLAREELSVTRVCPIPSFSVPDFSPRECIQSAECLPSAPLPTMALSRRGIRTPQEIKQGRYNHDRCRYGGQLE